MAVHEGEFVGITGKSGSGKSTILKLIYRSYLPQAGSIIYHSKVFGKTDLAKTSERRIIYLRRFEIGYVSQFLRVIPRTSARSIVEKAVLEMGESESAARKKAEQMLEHFELAPELWDSYPATFSGGEKLRLNIARAMIKEPRLLLLDEPTASLDAHSKGKVRELISLLKEKGTTMLGIFHDVGFMGGLCDRTHLMNEGVIEEIYEN
jgi:alpha-D-ribose 1-methylphosphonate 5-triphosphate synthase subunit PhnL